MTQDEFDQMVGRLTMLSPETIKALDRVLKPLALTPDARVRLTGKEYQMLELLSLRKGTTLTKEMFLNHLYGGMDEPELKIIEAT